MPAANTDSGARAVQPRRKKKEPARPVTPAPAPRGTSGAFGGASSQRPFARQQAAARTRTRAAARRLPVPVVAAPPVIQNPTRAQTEAARAQIVKSIRRNVAGSTGAARVARTDALMDQIATDPRLAKTRRAIEHYTAAEQQLVTPARAAMNARDRVRPGRAPSHARFGIGPLQATVNVTATSRAIANAVAKAAPGLQAGTSEAQFARNALNDVGALAKAPFVGGYMLGHAIVTDTFHGRRPGGGSGSETEKFAQGIGESTVHEVTHPGQALRDHPLLTLLDYAGIASVAGRTAGAAARAAGSTTTAAGARGALARIGSTARSPIALVDDPAAAAGGNYVERSYSKDLSRKAVQVASDSTREVMRHDDGSPVMVEQRGRMVPLLKPRHDIERAQLAKGRGDFAASRANLLERSERDAAGKDSTVRGRVGAAVRRSDAPGVRGRAARDVVAMVAEGTVSSAAHFAEDLKARLGVVRGELAKHDAAQQGHGTSPYADTAEVTRARSEAATIEKVLGSPKALAQAPRIVAAGEELARRQVATEGEAIKAGLFTGGVAQARRARLMVAAQAHVDARHYTVEEHAAAERAARAAGDDATADAVSGRHPERMAAHRKAASKVEDARGRARTAAAAQARAEGRVRKLAGAQGVRRGQDAQDAPVAAYYVGERRFASLGEAVAFAKDGGLNPRTAVRRVATSAAEARRVGEMSQARRAAKTARARRRAAETDLRLAQHEARGRPMPDAEAGLRRSDGRFLSNAEIEDALKAKGRDPESVAFLPHRAKDPGGSDFHTGFAPDSRSTLDKPGQTRTGALYARGGQGTTAELLKAQGVRQRIQIVKARQIDRLIGDHGVRHPAWGKAEAGKPLTQHERRVVDGGGYFTGPEAAEAIRRAESDTGSRLVAVRAFPGRLDAKTQEIIREDYQGPAGMESLGQRLLNSRFLSNEELKSGRARNVVLVNRDLVARLNAQLKPSSTAGRFAQVLNKAFRYAVLPQPRWLTGNFVEPYVIRLTLAGSGLNVFGLAMDIRASVKTLRAMDRSGDPRVRAAAQEVRAQQARSGLFVGGAGATVRRGLADFPVLDAATKRAYGKMVSKLPATQQLAEMSGLLLRKGGKAILAPLDTFFALNRAIESGAQHAALGRQIRKDIQETTGMWHKTVLLGKAAAEEAGRGLVNTPTQQRFMKAQYQLLGKYDGFGPTMRGIVQGPAPFIPWALNAARFVFWTMPAHHTAATALLTKINEIVEKDWKELHSNLPPGGLRLAIPNGKGGWIDLARYTPWGLSGPVAEGDPRALTSQFYPQVAGAQAAIEGKDPFGRDLEVSDGQDPVPFGRRLAIALNSGAEATVPYLSTARRLQEHGETAYGDSTVVSPRTKAGTAYGRSAVRRVFDPLSPTYLGPPTTSTGGATVATAPASRAQSLLDRRARLLQSRAAAPSRTQVLLERRAKLLSSR